MEQNDSTPTQPKTNNQNMTLFIILIVVIACLVVAVTILIILLVQQGNQSSSTESQDTAKKMENYLSKKNDITREDDISRFMTAATDFQANNNGKTPWFNGATSPKFVMRYIDKNCTEKSAYAPDENCGDQFRDPDGEPYYFVYKGDLGERTTVNLTEKHGIYVYSKAECGDEGVVVPVTGVRQVAMLYKLSDGSVCCNDNH